MLRESAYGTTTIRDIQLHAVLHRSSGRLQVLGVSIEGQLALPAAEFWQSLVREFGLAGDAPQQETAAAFEKVATVFPELKVRYRVEWDGLGNTWITELVADSSVDAHETPTVRDQRLTAAMELFLEEFAPGEFGEGDDVADSAFDRDMAEAADFTENFLADYPSEADSTYEKDKKSEANSESHRSDSRQSANGSEKKLPKCRTRRPLPTRCHADERCRTDGAHVNLRGRRYPLRTTRESTVDQVIESHRVKVDRLGAILDRLMHRSKN